MFERVNDLKGLGFFFFNVSCTNLTVNVKIVVMEHLWWDFLIYFLIQNGV